MRNINGLNVLTALLMFSPAWAQAQPGPVLLQASQKDFDMVFSAPFLEPGLNGRAPSGDEAMRHGAIEWTSAAGGRMPVSMWYKKAVVEFQTSPDRKTLTALRVDLGNNGLDVWRHRHGYFKTAQGYVWNSRDDVRPAMSAAMGADYDASLSGLWTLWARRLLERLLAGSEVAQATPAGEEDGYARLNSVMSPAL